MIAAAALALATRPRAVPENVLLIVADDIGTEAVGAYAGWPHPGRTPVIDGLAARGVRFERAWADPTCSATRATILTGRYGFRTGVGRALRRGNGYELPPSEWTIPKALHAARDPWTCIALGKWHLAAGGLDHPLRSGFDHHRGSFGNLGTSGRGSYTRWQKVIDGLPHGSRVYATTDTTDDAIEAVRTTPEPWFLYVAYNAAHRPYHRPPDELHDFELELNGDPDAHPAEYHRAMVQALDSELGRLLDAVDLERTTVVFTSDNGTQTGAGQEGQDRGKGTLYESGVLVPLIVAGPRVARPGSACAALVNLSDLYATVLEIAGPEARQSLPAGRPLDSVSLLPYLSDPERGSIRSWVYAERFGPSGFGPYRFHLRAVRGPRYKLIEDAPAGARELFDLVLDPLERAPLGSLPPSPAELSARRTLGAVLDGLVPSAGR